MARRRNSVSKRFAKIRGLPPEEKALMQRIGDLMDAALNNRQASNPFEEATVRVNRQVYPPTGLLAQEGMGSVKLIWDAANSNEHLYYEVEFVNQTTGVRTIRKSFTYTIVFRGPNGTYLAKVSSVGRDGSKSTVKQIEFSMGNDVMLIEGAKHGPAELGTVIQDNFKLYKGFSVYTWGSVVLDKQILDTNNQIVFKLWRSEIPDATFNVTPMILQETITLYPATESGADLDTTARAGLITRPGAARPGSYETSQAVMFSPVAVDDDDNNKTVTYFLQAINRTVENDEVCLSLTIWAGMDGVGSAVPGDSFTPPTPYVFPHHNSFHRQAPGDQFSFPYDTRDACAVVNDGYSMIGNEWTIAMWVRIDDLDGRNMALGTPPANSGNGGSKTLFRRGALREDRDVGLNAWTFTLSATAPPAGGFQHKIRVSIGWFNNLPPSFGRPNSIAVEYIATTSGDRDQFSALFPWGDAIESSQSFWDTTNNGWMFMVWCWSGGDFSGGVPKLRFYSNIATDPNPPFIEPKMQLVAPAGVDGSLSACVQTDEQKLGYQFAAVIDGVGAGKHFEGVYNGDLEQSVCTNMAYHQLGIWNTALDSDQLGKGWNIGPIEALFNLGRGTEVDWKKDIIVTDIPLFAHLNYTQPGNLIHLIQFGAVERSFISLETLRDTGYFLPGGEMNFTQDDRENDFWSDWHQTSHDIHAGEDRFRQRLIDGTWFLGFGQSWHRGTDIYDILSPTGSNNTTQYDWSHPGQNMS